jgi:hypothetical protein
MTTKHDTISTEISLRLVLPGQTPVPVCAELRFEPTDPYAVHVTFRTGGTERPTQAVSWTFARDLLAEGMGHGVGEGDVRVWPAGSGRTAVVFLALSSPSGRALFEVPSGDLVAFLAGTYGVVPRGEESDFLDVEHELELLLRAGGSATA